MLPRHGVLGIAATRLKHLVESSDSVALLELDDILADLVHGAGDVVALVQVLCVGENL